MIRFSALIYRLFLGAALLCIGSTDVAGQWQEDWSHRIDGLFNEWNRPNHPGGAVAIMIGDEVVYDQAFGLASLEYLVPNTTSTLFNVASVSKQFTAMGILLLEAQGKLSLDDPIKKHLPDLPAFGEEVTIRHMLHHTSGMRSLHAMLEMAGWRGDDARTDEDLYRFILRQKDLNFTPGAEYLYCNTGYILMAEIIERITGQDFATWTREHIFRPLGMHQTYVEDQYNRVVRQNATSYYHEGEGQFARAVEYWGYVGSGNVHSSTGDLLRWLRNFKQTEADWSPLFQRLQTRGVLNGGDTISYAFGVTVNTFGGHKQIQHGGSIGGYRSVAATFPELDLSVVILANFSSASVGAKLNGILDVLVEKKDVSSKPVKKQVETEPVVMSGAQLTDFAGYYWQEGDGYSRHLYVQNDTLWYDRGNDNRSALIPIGDRTFGMENFAFDYINVRFKHSEDGAMAMYFHQGEEEPTVFLSYEPVQMTTAFMAALEGAYYSPELDTHYRIYVDDGLKGYHPRHGEFDLKVWRHSDLEASIFPFRRIRVKRRADGEVEGLWVSNGRVRNLWFKKVLIN